MQNRTIQTLDGYVKILTIETESEPVEVSMHGRNPDVTVSHKGRRISTISYSTPEEKISTVSIGYGKHLGWSKETQAKIRAAVALLLPEAKQKNKEKRIAWELGREQRRLLAEQKERDFAAEVERTGRKPSADWDYDEDREMWILDRDSQHSSWNDEFAFVKEEAPNEFAYGGNHYGGRDGTAWTLDAAKLQAEALFELEESEREEHFRDSQYQRRKIFGR
jgi:hypothetical protein